MSFFSRMFGGGKAGEKAPSPGEAIQRLREIEEMLNKKQDFLESKVKLELETAKKHGTKNKRGKDKPYWLPLVCENGCVVFPGQLDFGYDLDIATLHVMSCCH